MDLGQSAEIWVPGIYGERLRNLGKGWESTVKPGDLEQGQGS